MESWSCDVQYADAVRTGSQMGMHSESKSHACIKRSLGHVACITPAFHHDAVNLPHAFCHTGGQQAGKVLAQEDRHAKLLCGRLKARSHVHVR